jgi:Tfp pilus assembly protein PilN
MILGVNLAIKPLETHRRFRLFSAIAVGTATVVGLGLGWRVYTVSKAEAAFRIESAKTSNEVDTLTAQREKLARFFSEPENAKLHDRASFINSIIEAQSFNWTNMFMDLEKILPLGVHVVRIEPRQEHGQASVKLTIGAASNEAKLNFLRVLEQSNVFSHLHLMSVRGRQDASGDQLTIELTVIYSRT